MKGILGKPVTTILAEMVVGLAGAKVPTTLALGDKGVDGVKFKDTTSALGMFDSGTLTYGGYSLSDDMVEVGVLISPSPSPVFDMTKFDETPRLG